MTPARARLLHVATAGAVIVVLAGCGGPTSPLSVGVVHYATDVRFGADAIRVAPPVPPGAMTVAPPSIGTGLVAPDLPAAPALPAPSPAAPDCAPPDPFAVALLAATTTIARPPKAATYTYRNNGVYQASGAAPVIAPYPETSTRQVANVTATAEGGFTFDVVNRMGGLVATTGYEYIPPSASQVNQSSPTAGLFITKMQQKNGNKVVSDFTASGAGLLLLQVPIVPGNEWTTSAVDATTGASLTAAVHQDASKIVDVCGQVVSAYRVHVDGQIAISESAEGRRVEVPYPGPTPSGAVNSQPGQSSSTTFVADYWLATQYGGLSVQDTVHETGTQDGIGVDSKNTSTISKVPMAP